MMVSMKVAIIGFGYWGPNLARNFHHTDGVEVAAIVDQQPERRTEAKKQFPYVPIHESVEAVFRDNTINAVAIATPIGTHYPLAKAALENGKHVLVEKPLTTNLKEAQELCNLAAKQKLVLVVDHTFLYTSAADRMKKMVDAGELGELQYYDSTRTNLGLFQSDVNVLWDLAAHDIAILHFLLDDLPLSVNAVGRAHLKAQKENIAYLTLNYASDFIAHFNCSWVSPVKIRQILVGGDKKMLVYNDLEPTEKLRVYDSGFSLNETGKDQENRRRVDYRIGDIHIPKLPMKEALAGLALDFKKAVDGFGKPRSGIEIGINVVKVLVAAQKSIESNGREVRIEAP
jgi:predicted dehydrogenase